MSEWKVVDEVRRRFRIGNYLFILAICWIAAGYLGPLLLKAPDASWIFTVVCVTGFGIFSIACAFTLAFERCPVCDSLLNRLRPRKERCSTCGIKIR